MNDIRFLSHGLGRGDIYVNGQRITGVLSFEPDLCTLDELCTVTIKLMVRKFTIEPKSDAALLSALGLVPEDFA